MKKIIMSVLVCLIFVVVMGCKKSTPQTNFDDEPQNSNSSPTLVTNVWWNTNVCVTTQVVYHVVTNWTTITVEDATNASTTSTVSVSIKSDPENLVLIQNGTCTDLSVKLPPETKKSFWLEEGHHCDITVTYGHAPNWREVTVGKRKLVQLHNVDSKNCVEMRMTITPRQ